MPTCYEIWKRELDKDYCKKILMKDMGNRTLIFETLNCLAKRDDEENSWSQCIKTLEAKRSAFEKDSQDAVSEGRNLRRKLGENSPAGAEVKTYIDKLERDMRSASEYGDSSVNETLKRWDSEVVPKCGPGARPSISASQMRPKLTKLGELNKQLMIAAGAMSGARSQANLLGAVFPSIANKLKGKLVTWKNANKTQQNHADELIKILNQIQRQISQSRR